MGLRGPCAERRGGAKPHGAAETGGCQGQRPLWAREHHVKPGFKELLTLILGQPPRKKELAFPNAHPTHGDCAGSFLACRVRVAMAPAGVRRKRRKSPMPRRKPYPYPR